VADNARKPQVPVEEPPRPPETTANFLVSSEFEASQDAVPTAIPPSDTTADIEILIPHGEETAPKADAAAPVPPPQDEPASITRSVDDASVEIPVDDHIPVESTATIDLDAIKETGKFFPPDMAEIETMAMDPSAMHPSTNIEGEVTFEKLADKVPGVPSPDEEAEFEIDAGKFASSGTPSFASPPKAPSGDHFGGDEDFTMETLIDVDMATISPYLKKEGEGKKASNAKTGERSLFEVESGKSSTEEEAAAETLEIVIAPNPSQIEKATSFPEKGKAGVAEKADAIPEETRLTRSAEMPEKGSKTESGATPSKSASDGAVHHGITEADLDKFDKDEEIITGDDIAAKIASLESTGLVSSAKTAAKPEKAKKKEAPAASSHPAASGVKKSGAPAAASGKKSSKDDDAITGDDVAEKIDSFFGLFEK
jgi:hypothetical protein